MKATFIARQPRTSKLLITAMIAFSVLLMLGFFMINLQKTRPAVSTSPETVQISSAILEQKYGLHVNLIGVTAAGGMVDLRLKILDAEKARQLISDREHLPTLFIPDSNVILTASDDSQAQEIRLENNGNLFLLFPNTRNAVKPGSWITIQFDSLSLEPIIVK